MLYDALERGELRAIRRGRKWLVPGSSVLAWMGEVMPEVHNSEQVPETNVPRL
jgi:Helix-turn-helix domain